MKSPLTRCRFGALPARVGFLALIGVLTPAAAATTRSRYYAHVAVHDRDGVIAPWYPGQSGLPHFHDNGMVEDNIDGGQITAREWSELIGFGPTLCGLEILAWLPDVFGAARENHLVRSTSMVNGVVYAPGRIEYTTFDAPAPTVDVLRLAFRPREIQADGRGLPLVEELTDNGFATQRLTCGDWLVSIRHDGAKSVQILGGDPQAVVDDHSLTCEGAWEIAADPNDFGGRCHVAETAGAATVHRFEGNQVRLIGCADPSGGLADVYLDGIKQRVGIDCWTPGAIRCQQVLSYRNGLVNRPHVLKVVARGEKNPCARGARVFVDAVQVSLEALDVVSRAGGRYRALDLDFADVRPSHGMIEIRLSAPGGEAILQALEVTPASLGRPAP